MSWHPYEIVCEYLRLLRVPPRLNGGKALLIVEHGGCGLRDALVFEWRNDRLVPRDLTRTVREPMDFLPAGLCIVPSASRPARLAMTYFDRSRDLPRPEASRAGRVIGRPR